MDALTRESARERFEALGQARGVPLTVQRRAVFEALLDSDDHPTVDEVFRRAEARAPGISQTTVYRVLDFLERSGVIQRIAHPGSTSRFDADTSRHDHIRCTACGVVADYPGRPADLAAAPPALVVGFEIRGYTVVYDALCPACRGGAPMRGE